MVVGQMVTVEDLWAMPETPGVRYELVEGELIAVPGAGMVHAQIGVLVFEAIRAIARKRNLGLTSFDGLGYILRQHPAVVRIPDVSFVSWDRLPDRQLREGFCPVAPDIAVEIVSPNDRAVEIDQKVHEYLEAGTLLMWVLWPRRRAITAHAPDQDIRELGPDDFLDAGEVLPGFRVRVADLFAV